MQFSPTDRLASRRQTVQVALRLLAWGLALGATLSIAKLPGSWGHTICGPWGCGPPLQALAACHLAWVVLIAPVAVVLSRATWLSQKHAQQLGFVFVLGAVATLLVVVAYQWIHWWRPASDALRAYFPQRIGFVVATSVDVPVLQGLVAGVYLLLRPRAEVD